MVMAGGGHAGVAGWLVEAGLGRHAEAFAGVGEAAFRALLMQDYTKYGITTVDDKQALFRLIKRVNSTVAVPDSGDLQAVRPGLTPSFALTI